MAISKSTCDIDSRDVIFHILIWLPVVTLLRFKSVCKSWRSLIESTEFITQHRLYDHRRNPNSFKDGNGTLLHLACNDPYHRENVKNLICYPCLLSVDKSEQLDLPIIHDPFKFGHVTIVASCEGIICLLQNRTLCLWNPATKQSTNLPPLPVTPIRFRFGLGFDVKTNNYKVVCLNFSGDAYVYDLSSDYWRTTGCDVLHSGLYICCDPKATYRNEICCWLGSITSENYQLTYIVYWFNFTNEVFGTIPLPDSTREIISQPSLGFLRGNIACIYQVGDMPAGRPQIWHLEIWMLKDVNVKESWIKLYTIGPFPESERWGWLMGFSKNGDFVSYQKSPILFDSQSYLYDLSTQETMNLPDHVCCGFDVILYEESLVSIRKGNGAVNSVTCEDHNGREFINQSMSSSSSSNSWCDIGMPEDVVLHILLRLPVVSLLRFKSVCKSWCSLINSSDFIFRHLLHHQTNNGIYSLILLTYNVDRQPFEDSSHPTPNISCASLLSAKKFELLDFPYCEGWEWGRMQIVASCNGIICLLYEEGPSSNVYLWNPATKEFREVLGKSLDARESFVGFGFDVKSNDYKLVQFGYDSNRGIHIYSLSTDSWRIIDNDVWSTVVYVGSGPETAYRNSIFCCLGSVDPANHSPTILSFDFCNEVLETIPLPDSVESSLSLELTFIRENICCLSATGNDGYTSENVSQYLEVWMLNEYAVKESWTKLYTIGNISRNWYPLIWSSKIGDFILRLKDGQLCLCNLATQETECLPVQVRVQEAQQFDRTSVDVVMYEESLVSIKRGNCA